MSMMFGVRRDDHVSYWCARRLIVIMHRACEHIFMLSDLRKYASGSLKWVKMFIFACRHGNSEVWLLAMHVVETTPEEYPSSFTIHDVERIRFCRYVHLDVGISSESVVQIYFLGIFDSDVLAIFWCLIVAGHCWSETKSNAMSCHKFRSQWSMGRGINAQICLKLLCMAHLAADTPFIRCFWPFWCMHVYHIHVSSRPRPLQCIRRDSFGLDRRHLE
jgi:hypothetical protein